MDAFTSTDIQQGIFRLLALLPALTLHEFSHAYFAYKAGDPTPAMYGRVTLNPLAHLDPIGTLMIIFAPIGWAKPVPINPMNFRRPRRDSIITAAVGPLSNLAQGVVWGLVLRLLAAVYVPALVDASGNGTILMYFLVAMMLINFNLALFNLVPLGPLDGHHIAENVLPYPASEHYREFNRYGMVVLIGLILLPYVNGPDLLFYGIVKPAIQLGRIVSGVL